MPDIDLLSQLDPGFADKLRSLLSECAASGVVLKPTCGLRSPIDQAKRWRQSRSKALILAEQTKLHSLECDFLAECIVQAGPQNGNWVTNAIPGLSWHQYGLACDFVWEVNGVPEWSATKGGLANGYAIMADIARNHLGLTTLGSIGDADHVQMPKAPAPDKQYTLKEINDLMKEKFANG